MRQDEKRSRNSRMEGNGRARGEGRSRSTQSGGRSGPARQGGGQPQGRRQAGGYQPQRRSEQRTSGVRRAAAGSWPDRLEVEQRRAQERKEQERRRRLKLRRKRKARIRKALVLFTAALFGIALFLGIRLVKNWTAEPGKKEEKIDIEKLAEKEEYPESLLKLLEKNPETKDFVMNYPKNKDRHVDIDVSKEVTQGKIPLFLQWDERWGYETYGDDFLALTGCGPTCLSMVRCGLSGDSSWNPYKTARMAENSGYYVSGSGSSWDLMT